MTLHDAKEWLFAIARSKRRRTLIVALLLGIAIFAWYVATLEPLVRIPYAPVILPFVVPIAILTIVWMVIRPDKTPPGHIGVVLALDYETEEEAQLVANDFLREVEWRLRASKSAYNFHVIIPSRVLVPMARDGESAKQLRQLCRAHFVLHGDIRTRQLNGKDTRSLRLDGLVCHANIPLELSAAFAQEMRQVLPPEHRIACDNDLDGFEVTSSFIVCSAQYVVAVAAMLSQDYEYAISLLVELRGDPALTDPENDLPAIIKLRELVPARLADSYLARSRQFYNLWRETRGDEVLTKVEELLEQFHLLRSNDPNYNVTKAICGFVLRRDIVGARNNLDIVRRSQKTDPTCLYGLAFLDAVEGRLNDAYQHYNRAIALDAATPQTSFEVEEFIEWYLSRDPLQPQMYFCLGYLNYKRKGDLLRARQDLQNFLERVGPGQFSKQQQAAHKWLREIGFTLDSAVLLEH
jgi:tetratricopeptide (TPR) repeat protein